MIQTKLERVPNLAQAEALQAARETFGWHASAINPQNVVRHEKRGDELFEIHESWVDITFQRDPDKLANFDEVVRLENEYAGIADPPPPAGSGVWKAVLLGLFAAIAWGVVFGFLSSRIPFFGIMNGCIWWLIVGIGTGVFFHFKSGGAARGKAGKAEYQAALQRVQEHRNVVLKKAWELSHER